jgi:hypothetical protein
MVALRFRRLPPRPDGEAVWTPWFALLLLLLLLPAAAAAQGPALTVDFKHATVGTWADYAVKVNDVSMKTRWAFLARDAESNTLELTVDGAAASSPRLGGRTVTRMVLMPDPIGLSKPFKQIVVQVGAREPVEIPLDLPGLPAQKFQNPDPKKRIGRETITVPAGTVSADHYRDLLPDSTVDAWLSDEVQPLGVVKIVSTPRPDAAGPGGRPLPPVTMELLGHGRDARPAITRPVRPFAPGKR